VILGVVEGITEFLPVSSTGHLVLVGHLLKFDGPNAASFDVFIQLGAILALVWLFRERWAALFRPAVGMEMAGSRAWAVILLGTLPALVAGALLHGVIKEYLFAPRPVALGLLVGGAAIVLLEWRRLPSHVLSVDALTWRIALGVGCFQCLALWPGISRSAATILGGIVLGLNRKTAAEFSFLLAVPIMTAAAVFDALKCFNELSRMDALFFAVGFATAFIAAWATVSWLLRFISKHTFSAFGWYRMALAAIVLWLMR
jgi:undecaprenyl-diphosphatase